MHAALCAKPQMMMMMMMKAFAPVHLCLGALVANASPAS